MLMSIIKVAAVSSFLTSRKYWNSRTFDYRTCRPVPNKRITPFPPTQDSRTLLDELRRESRTRDIFSPRPRL